jgi:hypothetical protein
MAHKMPSGQTQPLETKAIDHLIEWRITVPCRVIKRPCRSCSNSNGGHRPEELVGLPHCGPFIRPETCLHTFRSEFVTGGIGFYTSQRDPTGSWGWTLWVGLWED